MANKKASKASKSMGKKDMKKTKGGMLNAGNVGSPPASNTTQPPSESYPWKLTDPMVSQPQWK
jgi:hypothetical protein